MVNYALLASLLILLSEAAFVSRGHMGSAEASSGQRVMYASPPAATPRSSKVPGTNAAYLCHSDDQSLVIELLEISPFPPQTDQVQFMLIKAYISGYTEDALRGAKLRLRMIQNGTKSALTLAPLGAVYHVGLRQDDGPVSEQYSQRLKPGWNDITGDIFIPRRFWQAATYTFVVEIILEPDDVLACFTMEHFLDGDLEPDA